MTEKIERIIVFCITETFTFDDAGYCVVISEAGDLLVKDGQEVVGAFSRNQWVYWRLADEEKQSDES